MLKNYVNLKIVIFGLSMLVASPIKSQPVLFEKPLSPRIANYDIEVTLDTEKRMIHGKEKLTWFNKTGNTIRELQFHLYWNAFRNTKSTLISELTSSSDFDEEDWGFIEVDRVTSPTGEILADKIQFIHPDDANNDDKTVFRLPLSQPILPGRSIVLNIDFTAKVPKSPIARRAIAEKEYFLISQWFPKIGVYIDGKWNCHQYHRNSEFFADFGVYNVHITVPKKNIVGATGIEFEVKNNGDGTTTHFYHAEDVHDFAWTTSPEFIEVKDRSQDVDIRVLLQPDHKGQAHRHLDAAKAAVDYFQNWYGDYPYPNLTVVDPRREAMASAGMEYPTLITAGTAYGIPGGLRMPEMVIIHEFGHNFWYGMVANNEFEEAWLDEGINSYSESRIFFDHYGPVGDLIDVWGIKINEQQFQRAQYINFPDLDPIVQYSWNYYSGNSYGINSYHKPALMLTTLQNFLGKETMQKIMRTYFERWKFKHPKTQDFIAVANEVTGQNLNWFFDQALFTTNILDYSVDRVFTRKVKENKGYDFTLFVQEEDTTATDTTKHLNPENSISQIPERDSISLTSKSNDSTKAKEKKKMYNSGIDIRRLSDFKFPVEIEITFENGEKIREKWNGQGFWKKLRYTKPTKLVSATVDPDNKIPIDVNYTNNSCTVKKQTKGVNKLAVRFLFWMQLLLDQPDFLNIFTGIGFDM